MAEFDWDDDDDYTEDAPQKESNAVREARNAYKAMKKQNKELAERLAAFEKAQREASVKSVLTSKGLNPKIARFIPEDITSEEDVQAWVDEYAEVFGASTPSEGGQEAAPSNPNLEALNRISGAQASGQTFNGDAGQMESLIRNASNPEELNRLLFGNLTGPQAI